MSAPIPATEIPPSEERSYPLIYLIFSLLLSLAAFIFSPGLYVISGWLLWTAIILFVHHKWAKMGRVYAITCELNALATVICLLPLTFFKSYHTAKGNLRGRPVLLLNGYVGFASEWHYHRRQWVKKGFGPIYTMNVGSGHLIEAYAEDVQRRVDEIREETGRDDLILIGHSKGGLVAVYYAFHQTKEKITDVITIGSPLAGTPLARYSPGKDAHEMRPDDPFNKKLREDIQKNRSIRVFHIGSSADKIVPISSALIGTDPNRQLLLKDAGHFGLLFVSRISDQIEKWLKEV